MEYPNSRIQLRIDTEGAWQSNNPTIKPGELCISSDKLDIKVGAGSAWSRASYLIKNNPAFAEPSVVMLEQIRTIDKSRIERYLGRASQSEMTEIDKALLTSVALQYLCGNLSDINDALPTNP